jgi:anti-sigma regulatory factor (Ser/Thr protein kinase)
LTPELLDSPHVHGRGFRHEALFYAGEDEFVGRVAGFVRDGLEAEEPVLVAVRAAKIDLLRQALGGDAGRVAFADMDDLGANPARIIPAWREFADRSLCGGGRARGVGEPISPGRSPAELVECQRHESLLNLAFDPGPAWWLVCPYDTSALDAGVMTEARRSHPVIWQEQPGIESRDYSGPDAIAGPFVTPLPAPATAPQETIFDADGLWLIRRLVGDVASATALDERRVRDLTLAANEVASNSVLHAGGEGRLRIWCEDGTLMCEVIDAGYIDQPLAGRESPHPGDATGRGLWLANQLCNLVQIRSSPDGTTVRLHMRLR